MPRSFRRNTRVARDLAAEMCELCGDFVARHAVHTQPNPWTTCEHHVCTSCLPVYERVLRREQLAYRLEVLPRQS